MTKRMRRLVFVIALALCASGLLAACGLLGGQTGQEDKSESRTPCLDGSAPTDDDAAYAIGASPRAIADALRGPLHAPLTWKKLQTQTQVTLELEYAGDAAEIEDRSDCLRRLALDVTLVIKTDDGLLDEHVPATLWATASDSATLDVTIALAELKGTYDASEVDGATALRISIEWTGGATHGSVKESSSHETVATW